MSETCPNCGTPARTNYRFCSACGAMLPGATNHPGSPAIESGPAPYAAPPGRDAASDATETQTPSVYAVRRWDSLEAEVPPFNDNERAAASPSAYSPATAQSQPGGRVAPYKGQGAPGPPGPSGRRAGALYTPYSLEAARQIEKPRSERAWLIPVIVVCGLVLVGLVSAGIYLNGIIASNAASGPAGPSGQQPDPAEESAIRELIRRSNDDQIKSLRDLDTEILEATRIGQALASDRAYVQRLKSSNQYAVAVNESLEILEIKVRGDTAIVHTLETWRVTNYNKADNKVAGREGPTTLDEIYHLVKRDGKWLVSRVDIREVPGSPGS